MLNFIKWKSWASVGVEAGFLLLFLLFFHQPLHAQRSPESANPRLQGSVRDAQSDAPLAYAMVVLTNEEDARKTSFIQTGEAADFSFSFAPGQAHRLEVFLLGYQQVTIAFTSPTSDTSIQIKMQPLAQELQQVVVRDTLPPITRSGDTLRYNAASFATGEERKLNELVEKLPGLEVDDENNVTYKGQKVDKLLVEGKPFFGGSTELALTGLPAEAVKTVEVWEDYNPMGFSTSIAEKKKIALNIQLKEEKKNIVFGEASAGLGIPNHYGGRADLFNYRRKNSTYLLGGGNNINAPLLSDKQRMQLLGGSMSMFSDDYFERYQELESFQPATYARSGTAQLLGLGSDFTLSKQTDLQIFGIWNGQNNRFLQQSTTFFPPTAGQEFLEEESTEDQVQKQSGLLRLDLSSRLPKRQFFNAKLRASIGQQTQSETQAYRATGFTNRNSSLQREQDNFRLEGVLEYAKKMKKGHTHLVGLQLNYQDKDEALDMLSNVEFLENRLSWPILSEFFPLLQTKALPSFSWSLNDRYIHRFSHRFYMTAEAQIGSQEQEMRLQIADENSQSQLQQNHQMAHIAAHANAGNWDFRPSLRYQRQQWEVGDEAPSKLDALLPKLHIKKKIINIGELETTFQRSLQTPQNLSLLPLAYVQNFLGFNQGNPLLQPYLSSDFSLGFSRTFSRIFAGLFVNLSHQITQEGSILETLSLVGNERFFSYTQVDAPSSNSSFTASFYKHGKQNRWNIFLFASQSDAFINDAVGGLQASQLRSFSLRAEVSRRLGKKSDISLKNTLSRADFGRAEQTTTNYNWASRLKLKLVHNNWQFRPEIEASLFQFTNNPLLFVQAKSSLRYHARHSPWSFDTQLSAPLTGEEVFSAQQSNLFYSESIRRVQPVYVLFSIGYAF